MIASRSVLDLDQVHPAHRRAFAFDHLGDHTSGRFIPVQPSQHGP
jgi:hypothetical protein